MAKEALFEDQAIARKLELSERKRQVWAWVVSQPPDISFTVTGAERELRGMLGEPYREGSARLHILALAELGLIARQATNSSATQCRPYKKLQSPHWETVSAILTDRHGMHLPLAPIGEQLVLPLPPESMLPANDLEMPLTQQLTIFDD